jgi:hypothetical protein
MSQFQLRRLLLEAIRLDKADVSAAFQPSSIFFGCNLAALHENHWFSFNWDFKSNVNSTHRFRKANTMTMLRAFG